MKKLLLCLLFCLLPLAASAADIFPPASLPLIPGIDVSAYQGKIDWEQAAASGKKIVYIRATLGDDYEDPYFRRNFAGAKENGLAVGVYHYLTARSASQARAQARFFIDTLLAANAAPDCRPAMDMEGDDSFTREQWNQVAAAFLSEVASYGGYAPCIYSDASGARDRYDDSLAVYPLWVANYGVTLPEANGRWESWTGFQFADNGRVAGIEGDVDLDYFTQEIFLPAVRPSPTPQPTPTPAPSPAPTAAPTSIPEVSAAYYVVQAGDSLRTISARYDVSEEALRDANWLPERGPLPGQLLRIPLSMAETDEFGTLFIALHASVPYYTARHFAVPVSRVEAMNFFPVPGKVIRGQILRIPPRVSAASVSMAALLDGTLMVRPGNTLKGLSQATGLSAEALAAWNGIASDTHLPSGLLLHLRPPAEAGHVRGYVVQRGDALSRLARRFQTTVDALAAQNDLPNRDLLIIGQVLILP